MRPNTPPMRPSAPSTVSQQTMSLPQWQFRDLRAFEDRLRHYADHWAQNSNAWDGRDCLMFIGFTLLSFLAQSLVLWPLDPFKTGEETLWGWLTDHYLVAAVILGISLGCGVYATDQHNGKPNVDVRNCCGTLQQFNLRCDASGRLILPAQYRKAEIPQSSSP